MKKVRNTLGITTLVLLLVVLMKNEYGCRLCDTTYGLQTGIREGRISHLFIGSSMFRQGLDIDVLEKNLPGTVYILSYNGNQPVFMAKELEYLLEQGTQVENLYVDLYPFTAASSPWISDTKIFMDTDLSFKMGAWKLMCDNNETSFQNFYEMFVTANNEQLLLFPINNRLVSAQFRNGGTLLHAEGRTAEYLDSLDLGVREGINEVQAEGYRELISLAGAHGISIIFLETPKYEKLYKDDRTGGYRELLKACALVVEEEEAPYKLTESMNFDCSDASSFQDLIHLSSEGRRKYTEQLCDYLTQPLRL